MQNTFKINSIYATGIAGQNILYNFMSMYILFFFTDLLHIPPQTATTIIFIASLWDAINDPLMGLLVDKTHTRIGKFRPYLIGGSIGIFVTTVLCFTFFDTAPQTTIFISSLCYILWGMSYTVSDIPIWALSSVVHKDTSKKNSMITMGKIGGTLGVVLCVLFSVQLLNAFGGTRTTSAFFYSAIIVGAIAGLGILGVGLFVKENMPKTIEKISIRQNIQTLTKNKSLILLLVALFVISLITGIRQAGQIYFTIYTWGNHSYVTRIGITLVVGMIFGMTITPKLIQKFEKKFVLILACAIGFVVTLLPYFDLKNIPLGLISFTLSFGTVGIMSITSMSMLLDTIDYSESLLGFRGEGIVFSLNTFATKLSAAFSRLLLGWCLVMMNYTENQPVTQTTITWFSALMYILPAIACLLTIGVIYRYKLDKKTMGEIQ